MFKKFVITLFFGLLAASFVLGNTASVYSQAVDWDQSSLKFTAGCTDLNCQGTVINATVCNVGSKDMTGTVQYSVYYASTGNAKNGSIVSTGSVGPLVVDQCVTLTYDTTGIAGNYIFWAAQRPGHPGQGELWSDQCSVLACTEPTATPTATATPSSTDNPSDPTATPTATPVETSTPAPTSTPNNSNSSNTTTTSASSSPQGQVLGLAATGNKEEQIGRLFVFGGVLIALMGTNGFLTKRDYSLVIEL